MTRTKGLILSAALLGANGAFVAGIVAAGSSAASGDSPPECNLVKLVEPNNSVAWVRGCGGGPSTESPWQDRAAGRRVVMDGTASIDAASCPKSNPCVLLWLTAPGS